MGHVVYIRARASGEGISGGNPFRQKGCPPDPLPKTFKLCKLIMCSIVVICISSIV